MQRVHFLNDFLFLAGPEGLGKKTSNFGLNEYSIQNEKLTCAYIHKSVLIIDCHWHGFGGIRDRFDLISPRDEISNLSDFDRSTFEANPFLHTFRINITPTYESGSVFLFFLFSSNLDSHLIQYLLDFFVRQ
jgi:hypothetical protein